MNINRFNIKELVMNKVNGEFWNLSGEWHHLQTIVSSVKISITWIQYFYRILQFENFSY